MPKYLLYIGLVVNLIGCGSPEGQVNEQLFVHIAPEQSGIQFSNTIVESDTLNYFTFPYLYMGGGVAVGDINNDGLDDLYITGNMVPNRLYLNEGGLKFVDISESAGVAGDDRWYTGVTMADVNHDGWLDIYVCVSGIHKTRSNQLFINNQDNTFSERAEEYGLADSSASIQATFLDFDRDGLLDLFVGNYPQIPVTQGNDYYYTKMKSNNPLESAHLYKNNGNQTFSDVTSQAHVQNFGLTLGVVAADFNNDGWQDLYLSNDFNVPDYFYINQKDGTFKEYVKEATGNTSMFGMGVDVGDFNNDGLMDIAQVDMTPSSHKRSKTNMASMSPANFWEAVRLGFHHQYMQNSLQLNNGIENDIPVFSNISRLAGMATTDWSWGVLFFDMDNDGWKDVFITNGMKRDVNNNDANQEFAQNSFFGEMDYDYRLLPSHPLKNYAFKNNGDLSFTDQSNLWGLGPDGFSNGVAYGDLDNDGDLDLVINNLDAPFSLMENSASDGDNHYLTIKLKGSPTNPYGIGAKVKLISNGLMQQQELTLTRGFQSSVAPSLHFGLGSSEMISLVEVIWSDGSSQEFHNLSADQVVTLDYSEANDTATPRQPDPKFIDVTNLYGINFKHQEDNYDDFENEPLLPHRTSTLGPAIAVGDINSDGFEDFFIGNAAGGKAAMFVQDSAGFSRMSGPWEDDQLLEDTGALLMDIDSDHDLDLYIAHSGYAPNLVDSLRQDKLYINTPNGFIKGVLPDMTSCNKVIVPGDYNGDGHPDLFVGGRVVPGKYPHPSRSYILQNNGKTDKNLRFLDMTDQLADQLTQPGLVTAAVWDDFDKDGLLDLIITGEWMPLRFFKNTGEVFKEVTKKLGFDKTNGWWFSLQKLDVDNDGDLDYLAGNLGLNYKYHASMADPFEIYAHDFDENGNLDIVLSYAEDGVKVPLRGRECSSQQVPAIKQRFSTYEAFAEASLGEIYGEQMLVQSLHYQAYTFSHCWIENNGPDSFVMHQMPYFTQSSSINDFEVFDYNGDHHPDLLISGNLYGSEVETPRNDASVGLVLTTNGQGNMDRVPSHISGLFLKGEIKDVASIKLGTHNAQGFLVAANNRPLKLLVLKE